MAKTDAGALAELDEVTIDNLGQELAELVNGKAEKAATLEGYGITDAYKKDEVYTKEETGEAIQTAVDAATSNVYKFMGSVNFTELPAEGMKAGFMYNIKDAFETTEKFVEGAGLAYPVGTNVAYTEDGKWDCMAGIYDFDEFLRKDDIHSMTTEEIAAICVMPEDGVRAGV